MARKLALSLALALAALPALAQEHAYDYQDDTGRAYSDQPPPPGPDGSYGEYPAAQSQGAQVDVNVDLSMAGASVNFDTFHDGLAPYGEWVNTGYGRAWRPTRVAAGWRPYSYGRWEWTDEGWLWASDEPFGWAAYHYGRWAFESAYGWLWLPGYQWAPAWVTWRYSSDYIGWAPLGPGFSVYVSSYPVNYAWWSFVPCRRFAGYPVYQTAFTGGYARDIFHATRPAPPRAQAFGVRSPAWGGPARPFVEQRMGRSISPVRVMPVASAGAVAASRGRGIVPIYRPELRPASRAGVVAPGPARGAIAAPSPGSARPFAPAAPQARPGGTAAATGTPMRPWSSTGAARPAPAPRGAVAPVRPQTQGPAAPRSQAPAQAPAPPRYQGPAQAAPRYQAPSQAPAAPRYQAPAPAALRYQAPVQAPAAPRYQAPAPAAPRYQAPAQAAPRSAPSAQRFEAQGRPGRTGGASPYMVAAPRQAFSGAPRMQALAPRAASPAPRSDGRQGSGRAAQAPRHG